MFRNTVSSLSLLKFSQLQKELQTAEKSKITAPLFNAGTQGRAAGTSEQPGLAMAGCINNPESTQLFFSRNCSIKQLNHMLL